MVSLLPIGPDWPPDAKAYDYVRTLSKRDRAWEYLRRNIGYQEDFLRHRSHLPAVEHRDPNIRVYRLSEPTARAAVWSLSTFRRPARCRTMR